MERIRISENDLFDPKVEGYLEEQDVIRKAVPDIPERSLAAKIFYSSYFYLGLAGALGAFAGWAIIEPFYDDAKMEGATLAAEWLLFPTVAALIGLFMGASDGIVCRNLSRALLCGAVGLGVGFAGALLASLPARFIFGILIMVAVEASGRNPEKLMRGFPLFMLIVGRSIAWAFAALPAGIGQGLALREKKVVWNGILGGVLGGLLGGMLFEPIGLLMKRTADGSASRGVGLTIIGIMVGIFIGLVEQWTKTAWLMMRAGPLAGKQFIIYKNPTVIGSSPKADIYLFKDDAIEPRHALIHNRGGRYEIEDCGSADGTYVDGVPVKRQYLQSGQKIVMGKTVLEFALKEKA